MFDMCEIQNNTDIQCQNWIARFAKVLLRYTVCLHLKNENEKK